MRSLLLLCLGLAMTGCASADPPRQDSTAHPALQRAVTEAQTEAAAGRTATPAGEVQKCSYETVAGPVAATIAADEKCPAKPPASATP